MNKWSAALLLVSAALPGWAQEAPRGKVQVFDCDGRQVLLVVPEGSEDAVPPDPCALTAQQQAPGYGDQEGYQGQEGYYQGQPEARPSATWICAGGTCFPRSFILTPATPPVTKPASPVPKR
jgi:hypothetical protein